nr:molybdenum cofactor guanylyltransferase [uncultured Sphaerochaeta sp.]
MVSAVVLAGGKSSRMGQEKSELIYKSMKLIDFQIKKLASLGITDLLVSGYGKSIPNTHFVPDIYAGKGPLSGIHSSLVHAMNSSCLVVSVDTPLLPVELLRELIATHAKNQSSITLAGHHEIIEPLIGIYDCSLVPLMEQVLMSGNSSVKNVLDRVSYSVLNYDQDISVFLNCNNPHQYAELLCHAAIDEGSL